MKTSRKIELIMGLMLLGVVYIISINVTDLTASNAIEKENVVVVIDAGHGGRDPGKVSVTKELEKNINLSIAKKTKSLLEAQGITVVMTREEDMGLYQETDSNKKAADMRARCKLISESNATLVVSIHQNSFSSESVKGAQVFYYSKSDGGKELAEIMQSSLITTLDPTNTKKAKSNTNYYMLLHTECPSVIVECGFLSNWDEATKLESDDYQSKVAESILNGITEYLAK